MVYVEIELEISRQMSGCVFQGCQKCDFDTTWDGFLLASFWDDLLAACEYGFAK